MGFVLKLPTAGAASLPTLGDIGYISKEKLRGLYLINGGSGLADASGLGNTLVRTAGSIDPPYSAGVLQFRIANTQQLSTGVTIAGANQTIAVCYKKIGSPANGQVVFNHRTATLGGSTAGPMTLFDASNGVTGTFVQNWGQQAKRPQVNSGNNGIGTWRFMVGTRDAAGISLSLDGQAPVTIAYTTADPGSTTSNAVCFGDEAGGARPLDLDLGFAAHWDRQLSAAEIASLYKAVKRFMLSKGIAT